MGGANGSEKFGFVEVGCGDVAAWGVVVTAVVEGGGDVRAECGRDFGDGDEWSEDGAGGGYSEARMVGLSGGSSKTSAVVSSWACSSSDEYREEADALLTM